jgi:EmrB/QacA subfamily drug resistance transporter
VFALTGLGSLLVSMDVSIANAVLPAIGGSLGHPSRVSLSWVISAYAVSFAAVLVPAGRFADRAGRRRVFALGLIVFAFGSAICGAAPSMAVLLCGRVLQALGAAAAAPASLGLLLASVHERQRSRYTARWAGMGALGVGLGPLVGGALTALASWRLAFLINLPIVAFLLLVALIRLAETPRHPGRRLPDPLGALLLILAAGLLTLAVSETTNWGWLNERTVLAVGAGLLLGIAFVRRCSTASDPVLEISLLRNRHLRLVTAATATYSAAFFGLLFSFVLFLTTHWELTIVQAGLAIAPIALIVFALSTRAGDLAGLIGFRAPLAAGAALIATGFLLAIALTSGPTFTPAWLALVPVCGTGIGLCYPLLGAAALVEMPASALAAATALNLCARQIGAALGVAAAVAAIGPAPHADTTSFHTAWIVCAAFAALSAIAACALPEQHKRTKPASDRRSRATATN